MKKTIKILSIVLLIIMSLSIGSTCFARNTEEDPNENQVTLDSSQLIAEKEEAVASKTVDSKLIIGAIIFIVLIVVIIISLVVIRNRRKMK